MLSQKRLKELLSYDTETGLFVWVIKRSNVVLSGAEAGSFNSEGYLSIMIDSKSYKAHRLAWLYVTGSWPKCQIDHINHNRSDNKWSNLRDVTSLDNARNQNRYKVNKSGCTGVLWHKKDKRWQASIRVNGKLKHLGNFKEKEKAIEVRLLAQKEYGFHVNHGAAA
tara:strand:- start:95 stop:592 length:498 start_codon:yes stop_codon:yes gene_type:complete